MSAPMSESAGNSIKEYLPTSALSRRQLLRYSGLVSGAGVATFLLTACGGGDSSPTSISTSGAATTKSASSTAVSGQTGSSGTPSNSATQSSSSGMQPKKGGQLSVGDYQEPDSLDPHRTPSRHMWMVGWLIYDPLTISDDKGKIYPNLSTSWEIATDGLTYTFKLRNDVKFHDGTVFDATAVKYNLDRVVDPKTASPLSADDIGPYDSSTVVDDYTVAIKLKSGYGPLLRMLSLQEFGLISPTAADKEGLDGFGRHPVGTGPFKFVEWVAQDHITVAANPDYSWASTNIYSHSGPPYLDQVVYKYIIENQAREAALQTGEADAILNVPPQDVSKLQGDKDLQILKFAALGVPTSFILNANRPPTNDPAVRKALNQGLNRQQIVATLYADQNTPAYGALTPASFGYWDGGETANKYDLEGAKKTLDDAGWKTSGSNGTREKDGQKLTVELYVFPGTEPNAVAVQAALTELKVDIKITQAPWSDQATIGYQGKHNGIVVTFGAPDPRILRLLYDTANFSPNGWYWTHFKEADPKLQQQLDDLLNQGDSEDDPSKRVEIYQNAQEILIDNNLVLPVKNDFQIVGLKQTVQGWKMDDQNYQPRLYDVWLNK